MSCRPPTDILLPCLPALQHKHPSDHEHNTSSRMTKSALFPVAELVVKRPALRNYYTYRCPGCSAGPKVFLSPGAANFMLAQELQGGRWENSGVSIFSWGNEMSGMSGMSGVFVLQKSRWMVCTVERNWVKGWSWRQQGLRCWPSPWKQPARMRAGMETAVGQSMGDVLEIKPDWNVLDESRGGTVIISVVEVGADRQGAWWKSKKEIYGCSGGGNEVSRCDGADERKRGGGERKTCRCCFLLLPPPPPPFPPTALPPLPSSSSPPSLRSRQTKSCVIGYFSEWPRQMLLPMTEYLKQGLIQLCKSNAHVFYVFTKSVSKYLPAGKKKQKNKQTI